MELAEAITPPMSGASSDEVYTTQPQPKAIDVAAKGQAGNLNPFEYSVAGTTDASSQGGAGTPALSGTPVRRSGWLQGVQTPPQPDVIVDVGRRRAGSPYTGGAVASVAVAAQRLSGPGLDAAASPSVANALEALNARIDDLYQEVRSRDAEDRRAKMAACQAANLPSASRAFPLVSSPCSPHVCQSPPAPQGAPQGPARLRASASTGHLRARSRERITPSARTPIMPPPVTGPVAGPVAGLNFAGPVAGLSLWPPHGGGTPLRACSPGRPPSPSPYASAHKSHSLVAPV